MRWRGPARLQLIRMHASPAHQSRRSSTFEISSTDGDARAGVLTSCAGVELATPALLLNTRYGHSPRHCGKTTMKTIAHLGGASKFLNLSDAVTVAKLRDCQMFEFDHAPARTIGVHFSAVTGASVVTPEAVAAATAALRPDYAFTLADETTANLSKRRAENAAKRTARWTAEFLDALHGRPAGASGTAAATAAAEPADGGPSAKRPRRDEAAGAASGGDVGAAGPQAGAGVGEAAVLATAIVGSVPGHAIPHRGRAVAAEVAKHDAELSGYYIAGQGLGESEQEWRDIVATAKLDLPPARPLFVCGVPTPADVLQQIRLGFDVIESRCAMDATDAGLALCFTWPGCAHRAAATPDAPAAEATNGSVAAADKADAEKQAGAKQKEGDGGAAAKTRAAPPGCVDLTAKAYKLDSGPLVSGCACMACAKHTRAYVHHLLDTKEMLGWALLEAHNVHHMQAFVAAARAAVARQGLAEFTAGVGTAQPALALPQPSAAKAPPVDVE